MQSLMSGHGEQAGPQQGLSVETVLDRAVLETRSLGQDPALRAEVHATVGALFTALGKLDRAEPLLRRALELDQHAFGWNSAPVARDLLAWSELRLEQGQHADAEKKARQALEIAAREKPGDQAFRAKALATLGDVLNTSGRFKDTIAVLEPALAELEQRGTDVEVQYPVLGALANAHYYFGSYDVSERLNKRCLERDRQRYGEHHPNIADTLINLGAIATDRGRYADAEQLNRQALAIFEAYHGSGHPQTASALTIWARSLNNLERFPEAEAALQRALTVYRQIYPEQHPRIASTLNELGLAARQQGKLEEAERHAEGMLRIERALHRDRHHRVGIALANLATIFLEQQRFSEAEPMLREALAIYARTLAPDHLNVAVGRHKLGRCLKLQGRYAEAEVETAAGYDLLRKQATPLTKWLVPAGEDLIALHEALGRPERVEALRTELASYTSTR
jgi:eukaryotic-like serine/threonine-protein kinase